MKRIELPVKLYKYGELRKTFNQYFNSEAELKKWVEMSIKESDYIRKNIHEDDCEKWEQEFEYENKHYFLAVDL